MKILGVIVSSLSALILTSCHTKAQHTTNEVKIVGQMKNVMWKG